MKVAYVAGPYRDARGVWYVGENICRAREIARELWMAGIAAICPHSNTGMMDGAGFQTDQVFLTGDLAIMARCDAIVMIPGWQSSPGACAELERATELGIEVFIFPDCREALAAWAWGVL